VFLLILLYFIKYQACCLNMRYLLMFHLDMNLLINLYHEDYHLFKQLSKIQENRFERILGLKEIVIVMCPYFNETILNS
jgi:hypothetical protein